MLFRKAPTLSTAQRELLLAACARNQAADIHYKVGGQSRIAHARLIELAEGELRLDRPQCGGRDVRFDADAEVTAFFADDTRFFSFTTTVLQPLIRIELNRDKKVLGIALAAPNLLTEEQRRQAYRLSLAKYEVKALLHDAAADGESAPIQARHFTGRVVNISVGGMAVLFEAKLCPHLKSGELFMATLSLPNQDDPFCFVAETRHIRRVREGLFTMSGFRFLNFGPRDVVRQGQRIHQFIIGEQRRHLRGRVR